MVFVASVFKSMLPVGADMGSSLQILITTTVVMVLVMLSIKLTQLIRQRWAFEKALSNFPVAPDRHWLLGHLPKVGNNNCLFNWLIISMLT